ncbi:MAG: isoprenyl transferase [Candidatus Omnitrophica bacterium]|nr:isoprenyl transferase [Candidatus Omnitrophota bacterium]MDE2009960.1 isoprenyl transferase [Candidatus Omnitrophota bacterium]MDE2213938.1 isoprenyl transferase [Candidatus Omnitrophota bacterium]MDE2231912.1 isoprenyl transferase [Candidatus Omnitrophota bacterium]
MEKDIQQRSEHLPVHVAIIMDGNGRWAMERGMPRTQGHLEGVKRVEEIIKAARDAGIKFLTIYAFSTENWTRPSEEVSMIMRTFIQVLGQKARDLDKNGVRINFIGRRQGIPQEVLKAMDKAALLTRDNAGMTLNIAFNYGARGEIVDAVKSIAQRVAAGLVKPDDIEEKTVSSFLYTKDQPDPDLLIRTSGEVRISNFLLWQLSYAELYFTDKCWPEFNEQEFLKALSTYAQRERRWGGVKVS